IRCGQRLYRKYAASTRFLISHNRLAVDARYRPILLPDHRLQRRKPPERSHIYKEHRPPLSRLGLDQRTLVDAEVDIAFISFPDDDLFFIGSPDIPGSQRDLEAICAAVGAIQVIIAIQMID